MVDVPVEDVDFQQKVNEAPGLVPMIMAFADDHLIDFLSRYYAGELKVDEFLAYDKFLYEHETAAVEADHWRETADRELSLDIDGNTCEVCGLVDVYLLHISVGHVRVGLHRKLTHLPNTHGRVDR